MFSNNPLFLRDQDHLAKHADMIEAARAEPHSDSKEAQPGGLTGPSVATFLHIYDREFGGAAALAAAKAEIERLKADIERTKALMARLTHNADAMPVTAG